MLTSSKHKVVTAAVAFAVAVVMVPWLTPAYASSRPPTSTGGLATGASSTHSGGLVPHSVTVDASCTAVPTPLVARALGSSMTLNGPAPASGVLTYFNKVIRVKGRAVRASWIVCNYAHDPSNPGGLGVAITYIVESTSAEATAIARSMCAALRAVSPDYKSQKIGSVACEQGHTGPMQSANGVVAVARVVIELFGSQSPAQTVTLARDITPVIARAKWGTAVTAPPILMITTNQFAVENNSIPLDLYCKWGTCTGTAEVTVPSSTGPDVLAQAIYTLTKGAQTTVELALTTDGSAYFTNPGNSQTQVLLTITVKGAKTISRQIAVSTTSPTSTIVTTTAP